MKRRFWILLCLLAVAGAWLFWPHAQRVTVKKFVEPSAAMARAASIAPKSIFAIGSGTNHVVTAKTNQFAFRLSNTQKTIGQLTSDRHAILLENALIDTGAKINLTIPKHLAAAGDPGAFIVQARGPVDGAFRAALAAAGAQVVSYIPNNAYLVRLPAAAADGLAASPLVQAVLPYEPYYKVQPSLLPLAVNQLPLATGQFLTLGLFNDGASATVAAFKKLGGKIVGEDRSPVGPIVRVQPPADWLSLVQLSGVQIVEPATRRVLANDLARVTVGITPDTTSGITNNYLGLTGKNVTVEVNDSGVDFTHPDFTATGTAASGPAGGTRVLGDSANSLIDTDGHGTHVAGIIAGNGAESLTVTNTPQGSVTNADFRGKAPLATLFAVGIFGTDPLYDGGDSYLQEAAAKTNALISNNSWVNDGSSEYDLSAASYDAAVRDAIPERSGPQPVLFVFAAGNDGNGDNGGGGGTPDSIASPGTAKNVITVGALEQLRSLTNWVTASDGTSNQVWLPETDYNSQVAYYSSRGNVGIGTEGTFGRFKPDVVAPGTFVVSTRSTTWDQTAYYYYNQTNYHDEFALGQVVDTNGLNYYSFSDFGFVVKSNAVSVSLTIYDTSPTVANMPIYVSLANFPDPANPGTYDFVTAKNNVTIPPDSGGTITGIGSIINNFGDFNFGIGDSTNVPVTYDLQVDMATTNDLGDYYNVLSNLNQTISPWYRYETGTSMATPAVSGVLALMQDFFTNTLHSTPSPALLKAMLINGARPTGYYNYQVDNPINFEGWGLINLPNSIPAALTNQPSGLTTSFYFIDQSPTNALVTGDSRTYQILVSSGAQALPLRLTLAWTDPPGNPAAAIKLVNNLDLIVTNTDNPTNPVVYYGNDIAANQVFNSQENPTNPAPNVDAINNVENIFLPANSGSNFTVVISGVSVNVNAVTTQTTTAAGVFAPNIVQDFAFVMASGNGSNTNSFTINSITSVSTPTSGQRITVDNNTNPAPLLNQYVGASSPLLGTNLVGLGTNGNEQVTVGQTNQWHFYVWTNTCGQYSAFITFLPPTLSIPREGVFASSDANSTRPEADIDLYVTTDPNLLILSPLTLSNCINSAQVGATTGGVFYGADLGRGGSSFVVDTNSTSPGVEEVYYIGVKSEDQMASVYDFLPICSATPFSTLDANGDEHTSFYPVSIPDGDATHPGHTNTLALAIFPITLERVVVTNYLAQQNVGDLVISLNHPTTAAGNSSVVLMNHDSPNVPGTFRYLYDDSGQGDVPNSQRADGPGSLNSFAQQQGAGIWILHTADSAPGFLGSITNAGLFLQKHIDLTGGTNTVSIPPLSWFYDYVDVPVGYTNLYVFGIDEDPNPPYFLTLAVKYGSAPTLTSFDESVLLNLATVPVPWLGNSISVGPPLTPGTYWVGIYNPDPVNTHTVEVGARLSFSAAAEFTVDFASTDTPIPLPDDAVTTDYINVPTNAVIEAFNVGLRVDHPRISDLAFTLVSPAGARYLLMENRGAYTINGCGVTTVTTNIVNVSPKGTGLPQTNFIFTGEFSGSLSITYNFFGRVDQMTVYYSTNVIPANLIYDTGFTNNGVPPYDSKGNGNPPYTPRTITVKFAPTNSISSPYLTIIMNQFGNPNGADGTFWQYTAGGIQTNYFYLAFTEDTNLTTTPIKYAVPPFVPPTTTYGQVYTDSFEVYLPGAYTPATPFGNWTVLTNQVVIATNPPAYDRTSLLVLTNGAVATTLPTIPGRKYTLQYALGAQPFAGLYAANFNNGTVEAYALPNTNGTTFASGFQSPSAVAFDSSGNLYMSDASANTISKITPAGAASLFANTGVYPNALVFDGNGNLYVANYTGNSIQKITPAGVVSTYESDPGDLSVLNGPAGLAFDGTGTNLYVSDFNDNKIKIFSAANTPGTIFVADPGNQSVLSSPASLVFDSTGTNLFVANNNGTSVEEFPTPGTNGTFIILGLVNPTGLAFDNNGNLFVADAGAGLGIIYEYTTAGVLTNFTSSGLNNPYGLAYYSNINPEDTNSAGWQLQSLTFIATQTNTPLVLDASGGGFAAGTLISTNFGPLALFDTFTLTQIPSDLYYQAEQSLAPIIGTSAAGDWGMEVLDRRTGATDTNAALVSWQLEFVFANTNLPLPSLTGFVAQTNPVAAASIFWYQVPVPASANFATNRLLFADQPANLWFSPNNPPTITAGGDFQLLGSVTNGSYVIATTNTPTLVPGTTYYLGVQNTNSASLTAGVEVDFDHGNASPGPASLHFSAIKTSASHPQLQWAAGRGGHYQIQWADQITIPMVWHTITNPATTSMNGVSTFTDNGAQTAPIGAKRFYRLVKTK